LAVSQGAWSAPQPVSADTRWLSAHYSWPNRHLAVAKFPKPRSSCESRANERFNDHVQARVTTTLDRERPAGQDRSPPGVPKLCVCAPCQRGWSGRFPQLNAVWDFAGRGHAPERDEQLTGKATIILVLCAPLTPSVRLRNHCARALSFWNNRKRQASWIRPRRTRALPDLARPFSRCENASNCDPTYDEYTSLIMHAKSPFEWGQLSRNR
jgi:hypothetical protein